jgi:hypothetical protein
MTLHGLIAGSVAWAILGCAKEAASATEKSAANPSSVSPAANDGSASGADWTANGATACEKYLTPDVVAAILKVPGGKAQTLDARSCNFQGERGAGIIGITLGVEDVDRFRLKLPQIVGTHTLAGVGDAAYWNAGGAISAVKGHKRGCDISVLGAPDVTKIRDEDLGKKLGEICNKLFALP